MTAPIALSADERAHLPPPETRARLAAFARECIANSGGDADGGECAEKVVDGKASKGATWKP